MNILMITSELTPYAKAGGLGDMVGALPKALEKYGHNLKIILPLYGCVQKETNWMQHERPFRIYLGNHRVEDATLWETCLPGSKSIRVYFIEQDTYFGGNSIYESSPNNPDKNGERFAFLSRAGLDLCTYLNWIPDVIHTHDWPTALVPVYLNTVEAYRSLGQVATVHTIHTMEHQGVFNSELLQFAGIPESVMHIEGLEWYGKVNLLKGALYHATKLTTVSPEYAKEIQTTECGCGLEGVLQFRKPDLIGVLNGVDTTLWNPDTDSLIPARFTDEALDGKAICKQKLQERLGLKQSSSIPLFAVVSRLYWQKGLDLLLEIIPQLMEAEPIQIVVLGAGEAHLEDSFQKYAQIYPEYISATTYYDASLAHWMYAGSDFFIMPSRFEPCGLSQLYAMIYGSLPIVRSTGGLIDTVKQYVPGRADGTGFMFDAIDSSDLKEALLWACNTYKNHSKDYTQLQLNSMTQDFSWNFSAERYIQIYQWAIHARSGKDYYLK